MESLQSDLRAFLEQGGTVDGFAADRRDATTTPESGQSPRSGPDIEGSVDSDGVDGRSGAFQQQKDALFEVLDESIAAAASFRIDQNAGALLEFGQGRLERSLVPRACGDEDCSIRTEKPSQRLEPCEVTACDRTVLPAIHGATVDQRVVIGLVIGDEDHGTFLRDPFETDRDHPMEDLEPHQTEKRARIPPEELVPGSRGRTKTDTKTTAEPHHESISESVPHCS